MEQVWAPRLRFHSPSAFESKVQFNFNWPKPQQTAHGDAAAARARLPPQRRGQPPPPLPERRLRIQTGQVRMARPAACYTAGLPVPPRRRDANSCQVLSGEEAGKPVSETKELATEITVTEKARARLSLK